MINACKILVHELERKDPLVELGVAGKLILYYRVFLKRISVLIAHNYQTT
jgi:hypothetical protein